MKPARSAGTAVVKSVNILHPRNAASQYCIILNNLMRSYPGLLLAQETLNKRLSRGKTTIENTFVSLAFRRRALLSSIRMNSDNAALMVETTVVVRNFFKMHGGSLRKATGFPAKNASRNMFHLCDILKNY